MKINIEISTLFTLLFILLIIVAIISFYLGANKLTFVAGGAAIFTLLFCDLDFSKFAESFAESFEPFCGQIHSGVYTTYTGKLATDIDEPENVPMKYVCANCDATCSGDTDGSDGKPCPQCNSIMIPPVPNAITTNYYIDSPPNAIAYTGDCEYTEGYNEHKYPQFTEGFTQKKMQRDSFSATQCGLDQTNLGPDRANFDPTCCSGASTTPNGINYFNRELGQWIPDESYTNSYPPIAKELSNPREYQRVADPMNMIPFNGSGVPVDEKNTMMSMARERNKKTLDGMVCKTAEYYKKNYGDELSIAESKPWWGNNEY